MRGQINLGQKILDLTEKHDFGKILGMAWPSVENDRMLRGMLFRLSRASQLPYKAKIKKIKGNLINLINSIIFSIFPIRPIWAHPLFIDPPFANPQILWDSEGYSTNRRSKWILGY